MTLVKDFMYKNTIAVSLHVRASYEEMYSSIVIKYVYKVEERGDNKEYLTINFHKITTYPKVKKSH